MIAQAVLLSVVLAAGADAPQLSIAMPPLGMVGADAQTEAFVSAQLAQELADSGAKVITAADIQTLLGMERQRQLLSCGTESASCAAELAGALGADAVLVGNVAKLESTWQANLKLLSQQDAATVARWSGRAASLEALVDELAFAARALAQEASAATARALVGPRPPPERGPPERSGGGGGPGWALWLPAIGGAASGALAGYAVSQVAGGPQAPPGRLGSDPQGVPNGQDFQATVATGPAVGSAAWQTMAWVGGGLCVAGLATTAVLLLRRAPDGPDAAVPAVTFRFTPGGGGVALSGAFW